MEGRESSPKHPPRSFLIIGKCKKEGKGGERVRGNEGNWREGEGKGRIGEERIVKELNVKMRGDEGSVRGNEKGKGRVEDKERNCI